MKKSLITLIPLSVILLLVLILVIAFFIQNGQPIITGNFDDNETTYAINCTNNGNVYPFFGYDNSASRKTKIDAIFIDDELSAISLIYQLYYDDPDLVKTSYNFNNADMGISFGKDGLDSTAFNISFTTLNNGVQMSLQASSSELTATSDKYFLITPNNLYTKDTIRENYELQNFICKYKN